MYHKCLDKFQDRVLHTKTRVWEGRRFRVTYVATLFTRSQSFRFLSVAKLKNSSVLDPIGNEETSHQRIFDVCQTADNRPGTFERCVIPWSDVPTGALIQVQDILSICFEPWLDNKKPTVVKLGTCILSAFCELSVKCYIVKAFVVGFKLSDKLQNTRFRTYDYMNLFLCFGAKNSCSLTQQ